MEGSLDRTAWIGGFNAGRSPISCVRSQGTPSKLRQNALRRAKSGLYFQACREFEVLGVQKCARLCWDLRGLSGCTLNVNVYIKLYDVVSYQTHINNQKIETCTSHSLHWMMSPIPAQSKFISHQSHRQKQMATTRIPPPHISYAHLPMVSRSSALPLFSSQPPTRLSQIPTSTSSPSLPSPAKKWRRSPPMNVSVNDSTV